MANLGSEGDWLRDGNEERTVAFPELFFDLVFVFALIQLSHFVAEDFAWQGLLEGGIIALALWWVWVHTAWVTNWLDPQKMPIRALLFVLMFIGLLMASAIPQAFEHKSLIFALSYVAMQVGRSLFAVFAFQDVSSGVRLNFTRMAIWFSLSGLLWVGGAVSGEEAQLIFWAAALAVEYLAPEFGYYLPGFGRSDAEEWTISGEHMAERCALFIMICLGEAILAIGRSFSDQDIHPLVLAVFVGAFVSVSAMWWIYFHFGHERASREIERSDEPGEVALYVFTYAHIPLVAGIILTAVAAEHLLTHPSEPGSVQLAAVIAGGPMLFLGGNLWVKTESTGRVPRSHLAGLALLILLVPVAVFVPTTVTAATVLVALLAVAFLEYYRLERIAHDEDKVGELGGE